MATHIERLEPIVRDAAATGNAPKLRRIASKVVERANRAPTYGETMGLEALGFYLSLSARAIDNRLLGRVDRAIYCEERADEWLSQYSK